MNNIEYIKALEEGKVIKKRSEPVAPIEYYTVPRRRARTTQTESTATDTETMSTLSTTTGSTCQAIPYTQRDATNDSHIDSTPNADSTLDMEYLQGFTGRNNINYMPYYDIF